MPERSWPDLPVAPSPAVGLDATAEAPGFQLSMSAEDLSLLHLLGGRLELCPDPAGPPPGASPELSRLTRVLMRDLLGQLAVGIADRFSDPPHIRNRA